MRHYLSLVVVAIASFGCSDHSQDIQRIEQGFIEAVQEARSQATTSEERLRLIYKKPSFLASVQIRDSLLSLGPRIRYYNDSLARVDSSHYAYLLLLRVSERYDLGDTTAAVFAYLETMPWLKGLSYEAAEIRRFAETVGSAVDGTLSPNMARLAHDAFMRALQLAREQGDKQLMKAAMTSFADVNERLMDMPDSVRLAFAPSPAPSTPAPWSFAAVALVLGFIVGGSSWHLYRKKGHAKEPQQLTSEALEQPTGATHDVLDALWIVCNDTSSIPKAVEVTVRTTCRKPTSQRGMFMYAGLMAGLGGEDADPLKVANTVRSRLLRFFKRQQWEMMPGVQLPRDRDEWYTWFNAMGMATQKPSEQLDKEDSYV